MSTNVGGDYLALITIEGMHCHRCEVTIQRALSQQPGVFEVEVDFNSGQASVLYDQKTISVLELMEVVDRAGYRASGFTQRIADAANH